MPQLYSALPESIPCSSITVWFKQDKRQLERTVKTVEKITGTPLPAIADLHTKGPSGKQKH